MDDRSLEARVVMVARRSRRMHLRPARRCRRPECGVLLSCRSDAASARSGRLRTTGRRVAAGGQSGRARRRRAACDSA